MGIAILTLSVFQRFSRLGVDQAIVQRSESDVDSYLDVAWTLKVGRGTFMTVIVLLLAPYVADIFNEPRATEIIQVIAVIPLIKGLQNPGVIYFQKDLKFHKKFVLEAGATSANIAVAILYAILFQSVWALVFGELVEQIMRTLISYIIHSHRPLPTIDLGRSRELLSYGKWIFGSGILGFIVSQGDDYVVGWILGAGPLGLYQMAYRLSNAPATEISQVITSVVFPAYSQVQEDQDALEEGYLKTMKLVTFISFPSAVGILITAPVFVRGFLGNEWVSMIRAMQILAVWGLIRSFGSLSGPLFRAVGRPEISTKIGAGKVVFLLLTIFPAIQHWGIEGAAVVVVGGGLLANPVSNYLVIRLVEGSLLDLFWVLIYPFTASVIMFASLIGLQRLLMIGTPMIEFVLLVITGSLVYFLVIFSMDRWLEYDLTSIFVEIIDVI